MTGFLFKEFSNCEQFLYFFEIYTVSIYGLTTRGEKDTKKRKLEKKKKKNDAMSF